MSTTMWPRNFAFVSAGVAACALAFGAAQCSSPGGESSAASTAEASSAQGWDVVYRVLQHPRCLNCHPAGEAPLQGDMSRPHAQNVQRGPDGKGLFAMQCATCHTTANQPGRFLPPGAPNWHLPSRATPLVFEGRSTGDLCRQMRDPKQNGGKTPEQVFEHLAGDPLVMWGWAPGEGRNPVSTPHDELTRAARAWVDGGCGCPE